MSERTMVYRRKCRLQKLVRERVITQLEVEKSLAAYATQKFCLDQRDRKAKSVSINIG
jgi:hypothetical protein